MDAYRELGIEPIINAAGTLTTLGGSLMPPEVTDAMAAASRAFVDLNALQVAAGKQIAEWIGVPAAHVSAGAASGITLMAAACLTGTDQALIRRLPDVTGLPHRFVVQRPHRNFFDTALRLTGARFLEIDADADELEQALDQNEVAGVYYTFAWFARGQVLSLREVADAAHARDLPVIVDAAAEVPPLVNFTRFLDKGADLVAFSGGKAIRGPQCSGLILGQPDLVEACRLNHNPNMGVGRPMKVGKEEIMGLVKAVELYVNKDHEVEMALWEQRVAYILAELEDITGLEAWRQLPYGIGQQIPHVALRWDEAALRISQSELVDRLITGEPRIAIQLVVPESEDPVGFDQPEIRIHPHMLQEGEAIIVANAVRALLT